MSEIKTDAVKIGNNNGGGGEKENREDDEEEEEEDAIDRDGQGAAGETSRREQIDGQRRMARLR